MTNLTTEELLMWLVLKGKIDMLLQKELILWDAYDPELNDTSKLAEELKTKREKLQKLFNAIDKRI